MSNPNIFAASTQFMNKNWTTITSYPSLDEVNSIPKGIMRLTLLEHGLLPLLRRNNKGKASSKYKLN